MKIKLIALIYGSILFLSFGTLFTGCSEEKPFDSPTQTTTVPPDIEQINPSEDTTVHETNEITETLKEEINQALEKIQSEFTDASVFASEVLENYQNSFLLVGGLGWLNDDLNYKGEYYVSLTYSDDEIILLDEQGQSAEPSDFSEGDIIVVCFSGVVLETNPARVLEIILIQKVEVV
ncbi:MAG: hypothetical protein FWG70_09385 [Oscillospiraceae bacterium]|nr:hypothetical protein [Oscillospiraceae bacterium]